MRKSFNLETHETRTESDQIVFAPETKLRIKYTFITHAVQLAYSRLVLISVCFTLCEKFRLAH